MASTTLVTFVTQVMTLNPEALPGTEKPPEAIRGLFGSGRSALPGRQGFRAVWGFTPGCRATMRFRRVR